MGDVTWQHTQVFFFSRLFCIEKEYIYLLCLQWNLVCKHHQEQVCCIFLHLYTQVFKVSHETPQ